MAKQKYPVTVQCDPGESFLFGHIFRRYGLTKSDGAYRGKLTTKKYQKLLYFCKKRGISCIANNGFGERSGNYRKNYFENNPPHLFGKYFCAYCGRLLTQDEVTIDHIYPVAVVKKNLELQKRLKKKGYSGVNDTRNLVQACWTCNSIKGKKVGKWIRKGKIGRIWQLWIVRYILRLVFIIAVLFLLYKVGVFQFIFGLFKR